MKGDEYMDYYNEIKNKLIDNEVYSKVKDYSKERNRVLTYYEIGKLLTVAGGKYGDNIIDKYSKKLIVEVDKKYNKRTLFRMKQFYNMFNSEKVSPLATQCISLTQLTWSHYTELLSIKDINALAYYMDTAIKNNLSKRELREKIKSKEYERLDETTRNKLITNEKLSISDEIRHPIMIKNKYDIRDISEKMLKRLILDDMDSFT